jgi:hypothetical protein
MNELKTLWTRLLGDAPSDQQFDLWSPLHTSDIIHRGIIKTAQKNLSLNQTMDLDRKIRFASKVMLVATDAQKEHAANRARLKAEMEAGNE